MSTNVKIVQVLNAALAAGVFVCMAQAIAPMAIDSELDFRRLDPLGAWAASVLFLWNTKNFVDDYRAFDRMADRGFSLAPTVFFSAAAYLSLAMSAATLSSARTAATILVGYFFILAIWSTTSFIRRWRIDLPTAEEDERLSRRLKWILKYSICATLTFLVARSEVAFLAIASGLAVLAIFAWDAADSCTFSSNRSIPA